MPLFPPNLAYGRVASVWRSWATPWVHRSGSWVTAERVWVYSAGSWRLVWTETATPAENPLAVLQGNDTVVITWDAPAGGTGDPEVATSYSVRRSDNSLVGSVSVTGGSYSVTDSTPLAGTNAYTIWSLISGVQIVSVTTNTVTVAPAPTGIVATTSNVGVDTNVGLVWVDSPGAATYNVYRPGGTFIGSTAGLSFTDANPQPGIGGYKVSALALGGAVGGQGTSNSLTLAQAPTSLTASAPTSGDNVALAWLIAGVGVHDQIQVVRGGSSLVYLAAGSTSYTDTNAREGTIESYQVRAVISGNVGSYSNTATSSIPPNVPTFVTASATAVQAQLQLTWGNPAGSYTGYEVQVSENGSTWTSHSPDTSGTTKVFAGSSGLRYMRVRTLSAGGSSAYVTASATPLWLPAPTGIVATTSNVGVNTNVDLVWQVSSGAATYEVYRPNGTLLGSTANLYFQDTDPLAGTGSYSVQAYSAGGLAGGTGTSNSLTLAQAPTSMTAGAPTSGDNVALAWSVASVGVYDQIQVVRGGTSLVYLAAGSTSYTDTDANEGTVESYKVRAVISGNPGPYSNTANSSIPANMPTSVTAVPTAIKGQLALTWATPAGSYTGYQIQYYSNPGGVWTDWLTLYGTNNGPVYRTWSAGSGTRSLRIRTLSNGGSSAYATVSNIPVWLYPPSVPASVTIAPTATQGQLTLSWATPPVSGSTDPPSTYVVGVSSNGTSWVDSVVSSATLSWSETFAGSSGVRYMRVKSSNGAGDSAFVTKSATPLWDTTPPAVPTITSWKPEASYGRMVLRFTTSSSDNYQYRIQILTNGFPSTGAWTSVGNSQSVVYVAPTFASGQTATGLVEVRDQYLNTSAQVGGDYTLKPQVQSVFANSSGNFRQGSWNAYTGNSRPYQGYFSTPSFVYTGCYFFATNAIYNAIQATSYLGGTISVTGMSALVVRVPGIGNSVQTVYMGTSATASASGTPSVQNIVAYPNLSTSSSYQPAFNAAAIAAFSNGTAKSVGFYVNSTAYSAFYMPSENVFAGMVEITSLG